MGFSAQRDLCSNSAATDRSVSLKTGIADRVTVLLHSAAAWGVVVAAEDFRGYGLNVQGARVLISLLDYGSVRVGQLRESVAIDNSTLSHLLRKLEQKKLVVRKRLVEDNRAVCVALTGRGQKIAEKCKAVSLRHEALFLEGFTLNEISIVRDFLRRVYKNIENAAKKAELQQKNKPPLQSRSSR